MTRSLLLGALALGLFAGAASAQGVYVNGVYTQSGQSITVPADGSLTINGAAPTFGTEYAAPAAPASYGGQYTVIPETGLVAETTPYVAAPATYGTVPAATQTYTVPATGGGQTFTLPESGDATYNVVVPAAPAPAVTYAQPVAYAEPAATGWGPRQIYVGARGGVSYARESDFDVRGTDGSRIRIDTEYDNPGFLGSAVVGYRAAPGNGWIGYRVELEGGYQSVEVDEHRLRGVGTFRGRNASGDANILYGFVNVYGDVPITDRIALTAGGGVGVGRVEFDDYAVRTAANGRQVALDDDATAFGYHLDAGVTYQLTDSVALEAMYRYQSFVNAGIRTEGGNSEDVDLDSHNVLVGARVGF